MRTPRQQLAQRFAELKAARSPWERNWRSICEQMLPYRPRWDPSDVNKGDLLNDKIINATPLLAVRVLSSGMMAGITSPSREWFRLTTADPKLEDSGAVRAYLFAAQRRILWALARSNWYSALADGVYRDLGTIATAALFCDEDPERIVRFRALPIGEYYLDVNESGEVDTIFRELPMTVRQLIGKFGIDNVSPAVKTAWENSQHGLTFTAIHAVYPNDEFDSGRLDWRGKGYVSRWFELSSPEDQYLRVGGYEAFPAMTPRWYVTDGDVYGKGPGWDAVGDCKGLQHLEVRKAEMVDKVVRPPMKAPESLRGSRASLLPGDVTYYAAGQGDHFEPAMVINPAAIGVVKEHIQAHEVRIDRTFFVDLWLTLINDQRSQRATATEIQEAKQESMLQLGPMLENLNTSLLEPAIERVYRILLKRGLLPEAPRELQGSELKVEFISIMHQMQKMTQLAGVATLVQTVAGLAQAGRADALDKLNVDVIVDEVESITGGKPGMVLSAEEVAKVRAARAQAAQQQQQGQAMLAATQGLKNLSGLQPQQLEAIAQQVAPAAAAQGGITR